MDRSKQTADKLLLKRIKGRINVWIMLVLVLLMIPCNSFAEQSRKVVVSIWDLEPYISGMKSPPENLVILLRGASVAPEGSSWWNYLMNNILPEMHQLSKGLLDIKFYGGGVLGDESDTIRKMQMKRLQILGVTNMGLTQMLPEMCVFELPFLFDWEPDLFYAGKRTQVDYILEKLETTVAKLAEKQGYVFAGFLETCFETLATKIPLKRAEDLTRLNFWFWEGDRIRKEINHALGIKTAIPLELYDVSRVLSTGLVDTTMCAWYVSIVLQWWPYVTYASDYPFYGYESATILFDSRVLDQLLPFFDRWGPLYGFKDGEDFRREFLELWDRHTTQLRFLVRHSEAIARETLLKEKKIQEIHFPEAELEKLKNKVLPLYDELADKKYPKALLDEILKYREEYRKLKKEGKLDNNWFEKGIMPDGDQRDEWRL